MSTVSRRDNSPDVIQAAFSGSLTDVDVPPPLKPLVARHPGSEDNVEMYGSVEVCGQMYANTTTTGEVSTYIPNAWVKDP